MKKQPQITDATREAFIQSFLKLAKQKHIHQITIKEITQMAGYNRTTFYRYFEDIYALVTYLEDEFINDLLETVLPLVQTHQNLDEEFFRVYFATFKQHYRQLSVLLSEENRGRFICRVKEQTLNIINTQQTPKKAVVTDIYFTGIFTVIANQLHYPLQISDEELIAIIRSLFSEWYWPMVSNE